MLQSESPIDARHPKRAEGWAHVGFLFFNTLFVLLYWHIEPRMAFDDAYIFMRYARNLHAGHGYVYNPGEAPVDGITSPVWLAVVGLAMPPGGALPDNPALLLATLSFACGVLFMSVMHLALALVTRPPWRILAGPAAFLSFVWLSLFGGHLSTGMETLLAALVVPLFVALVWAATEFRHESMSTRQATARGLSLGIAALLLIFTRPEAGLLAMGCPALKAFADFRAGRRAAVRVSLVAIATASLLLLAYLAWRQAYFGMLLPLPFYVKGTGSAYGAEGIAPIVWLSHKYRWYEFVRLYWPAMVILAAVVVLTRSGRATAWVWIPWLGVILYLFQTYQVMGHALRYFVPYLPVLPLLVGLTSHSASAARVAPDLVRRAFLVVTVGIALMAGAGMVAQAAYRTHGVHPELIVDPALSGNVGLRNLLASLPPTTSIATTEVGLPGILLPEGRIDDLAGLNHPVHCRGFDLEEFFRARPDVVTLVHGDYYRMVRQIITDPRWAAYTCIHGNPDPQVATVLHTSVWARREFVERLAGASVRAPGDPPVAAPAPAAAATGAQHP